MTEITSMTVLHMLEGMNKIQLADPRINIIDVAAALRISTATLVTFLTELEHQDEIIMEISSKDNPTTHQIDYTGTVRVMDKPLGDA